MKQIIDAMLIDCSKPESFSFSMRCAECGMVYHTRPIRFSKAGVIPASDGKRVVYDILYEKERSLARAEAVKEVAEHFNRCPICHRVVCNRCFLVCEDLDICKSCAASLNETGTPVAAPGKGG